MANGKVCTGFSIPYVAKYSHSGTTVTYSNGQPLARGVEVSIEPEVADDNNFYADNVAAESASGIFGGGTVTLTVDGLLTAAERLIMGLPTASTITVGTDTIDVQDYGDAMSIPYMGIAFAVRYMSAGVTSYDVVLLTKTRFSVFNTSAATQEDEIDWQTQELTATLMRDDTAAHNWKRVAEGLDTEEDAKAVINALLNITQPNAGGGGGNVEGQ